MENAGTFEKKEGSRGEIRLSLIKEFVYFISMYKGYKTKVYGKFFIAKNLIVFLLTNNSRNSYNDQ